MTGDSRQWCVLALRVVLGWLIYKLAPVITPFAISAGLAYLGDPLVDRLQRMRVYKWPVARTAAVIIVFLLMTAAVGLLLISLTLGGCQKQAVRDGGDASTGALGSPLVGPSQADVYINLSAAYLQNGSLTEAFKNAKKAVLVDPRYSNAFYMQALVYQRLGQRTDAEAG